MTILLCFVIYFFYCYLNAGLLLASRVLLSEKENIDPNVMMAVPNVKTVSSCWVVNVIEDMRVRAKEMATDSEFTNLVKKEMDTNTNRMGWSTEGSV